MLHLSKGTKTFSLISDSFSPATFKPSIPREHNYWILISSSQCLSGKESVSNAGATGDADSILGQEYPLKEEMATHSSILAWRIPWTEKPGRLQSMGSQRVRHDWNDLTFINSSREFAVITKKLLSRKERKCSAIIFEKSAYFTAPLLLDGWCYRM